MRQLHKVLGLSIEDLKRDNVVNMHGFDYVNYSDLDRTLYGSEGSEYLDTLRGDYAQPSNSKKKAPKVKLTAADYEEEPVEERDLEEELAYACNVYNNEEEYSQDMIQNEMIKEEMMIHGEIANHGDEQEDQNGNDHHDDGSVNRKRANTESGSDNNDNGAEDSQDMDSSSKRFKLEHISLDEAEKSIKIEQVVNSSDFVVDSQDSN